MVPLPVAFAGGASGTWQVQHIEAVLGSPLPGVARVVMLEGNHIVLPEGVTWVLRGVISHERYVERPEREALVAQQPGLGRPEARRAALIAISKSEAWWELAQDERRAIFEDRSHHIATGLKYLPAIARRLCHSRDLGEPFDFLTWFEFFPIAAAAFEELVGTLRETEEWTYVEREVDIRLERRGVELSSQ